MHAPTPPTPVLPNAVGGWTSKSSKFPWSSLRKILAKKLRARDDDDAARGVH